MQDCPGCQRFLWSRLVWCSGCLEGLVRIPNLSSDAITLFAYEEPLKSVLILFKSTGSFVFESALIEALGSCEEEWRDAVNWCELIVCAPQSLSSWLKLKSNPAKSIGIYLAEKFTKEIFAEPCTRKFGKQSSRIRVNQHKTLLARLARPGKRRVLIVDDVLTSGGTLLKLAAKYPDAEIKVLCLFRSRAMDL